MVEVSTSILSVKKENILGTIYNLEVAKTDYYHIDVMDGEFVKNNTNNLMQDYLNSIKEISNIPLDIHLMVNNIKTFVDAYLPFEPNIITFHIEACKNKEEVLETIKYIKNNNVKVGIAVKPETKIEEIYEYIPLIHEVLVMTVEPGKGGQKLIPETVEKVKQLKQYLEREKLDIDIEVDGGVTIENKEILKNAGANILVSGSCIVNSKDYKEAIQALKE
jgi:ribulose-phosphate 3-epimerase